MRISDWSSDVCSSDLTTVAIRKAPSPPPVIRKPEQPSSGTQAVAPETRDLEAITVTGTRIRGGTSPSPVITIGSENIQQEGFTDLGEVIRSIPQNFSGGQNPGAGSGNIAGAGDGNQTLNGGPGPHPRGRRPEAQT